MVTDDRTAYSSQCTDLALSFWFHLLEPGRHTSDDVALLRDLVRTYDQAAEAPLSAAGRASLPLAIARQPPGRWGWILRLGEADAVRHAYDAAAELPVALSVMRHLEAWQHALRQLDWWPSGIIASVQRVVVLGRGAAGKSTAAVQLGQLTGLPVIELDKHFWSSDLRPLSGEEWARVTSELAARPSWVMDGDLGPYDVLAPRLRRADTVLVLDYGLLRCVWRAHRRSRDGTNFWRWVLTWRRRSRPVVLRAIAEHAPTATCHVVKKPKQLTSWFSLVR